MEKIVSRRDYKGFLETNIGKNDLCSGFELHVASLAWLDQPENITTALTQYDRHQSQSIL